MDKFMMILAYDGDGCGKKVGRAIMANDEKALGEISAKIDLGHEIVNHWVADHGGSRISGGGDEGTFQVPHEALSEVEQLRKDHEYATGITISIGIGKNLSEAGRALLAAKFRGKDQIAEYSDDVEKDIKNARKRVKKGKATQEEYKLAEAYLEKKENNMANKPEEKEKEAPPTEEKDCQYCDETDGVDQEHCKYCHDADAEAEQDNCPYCEEGDAEADASLADCPYCKEQAEGTEADCPYCQEQKSGESPDAQADASKEDAEYEKMGMSPPGIAKPEVGDGMSPSGQSSEAPIASPDGEGVEAQAGGGVPIEDAHSKDALIAIAEQIEGETIDGKPDDKAEADAIDDTDIVGNSMQGNVSRPSNFESNTPGDAGLDTNHPNDEAVEESNSPDMSSVLQEGLNNNADDIQRERVREMVGLALTGFKASKQVLETAKEQAPELYNASIMMLKAMIEMAQMLGLGSAQGAVEDIAGEPSVPMTSEDEWEEPFAPHPDQGGQRKPGHAAGLEDAANAPQQ